MKEGAQRARSLGNSRPIVVTFFFNARGTELERTPLGLFRSLVLQLFRYVPTIRNLVLAHYRQLLVNGAWNPEVEELQKLLLNGLQGREEPRVIFFIDALDECENNSVREVVHYFRSLSDSLFSARKAVEVCLSSRHYPNIIIPNCHEIVVESGNERDIAHYIDVKISYAISSQNIMLERLRSQLQQKASGIFLWVVLVVDIVLNDIDDGKSSQEIEETVRTVPQDLAALYARLLNTLTAKERHQSLLLIQWVLLSQRQLQAMDVQTALILGSESIKSLGEAMDKFQHPEILLLEWDGDVERVRRNVRTLSRGLVEVVGSHVQFIHESVRQFILGDGCNLFGGSQIVAIGHLMIVKACLHGLCILQCLGSRGVWSLNSETFLFDWIRDYAPNYLPYHTNLARRDSDLPHKIAHLVLIVTIFSSRMPDERSLSLVNKPEGRIFNELRGNRDEVQRKILFDTDYFSLCVSAASICNHVIGCLERGVPAINRIPYPPLLRALEPDWLGWADGQSADGNLSGGFSSEFHYYQEKEKVFQVYKLLSDGADIDLKDSEGNTAVHTAAAQGLSKVTERLLDQGAVVNIQNEYETTPLFLACLYCRLDVVVQLLSSGADPSIPGPQGLTPLHLATMRSDLTLAETLLKAGAAVNAATVSGKTAMHLAAKFVATKEFVELLSQEGADFDARDEDHISPFVLATALWNSTFINVTDPRKMWSGSTTNFEKTLASRIGHRSFQPQGTGEFGTPTQNDLLKQGWAQGPYKEAPF
jgi:Ankyrin repeats (3 copies)